MSHRMPDASDDPSRTPALRLAVPLFVMGILHFLVPKPFDSIIPKQLPGSPRTYTYLSGVAELGVAGAVAAPRTRRLGGRFAALLFIAVFPANIQFAVDSIRNPKANRIVTMGALVRLPLQVPMISQALSVSRRAPRS